MFVDACVCGDNERMENRSKVQKTLDEIRFVSYVLCEIQLFSANREIRD